MSVVVVGCWLVLVNVGCFRLVLGWGWCCLSCRTSVLPVVLSRSLTLQPCVYKVEGQNLNWWPSYYTKVKYSPARPFTGGGAGKAWTVKLAHAVSYHTMFSTKHKVWVCIWSLCICYYNHISKFLNHRLQVVIINMLLALVLSQDLNLRDTLNRKTNIS